MPGNCKWGKAIDKKSYTNLLLAKPTERLEYTNFYKFLMMVR